MTDNNRVTSNPAEDGKKEPARSESQPGPTYENPNEDETYVAPGNETDRDEEHRR